MTRRTIPSNTPPRITGCACVISSIARQQQGSSRIIISPLSETTTTTTTTTRSKPAFRRHSWIQQQTITPRPRFCTSNHDPGSLPSPIDWVDRLPPCTKSINQIQRGLRSQHELHFTFNMEQGSKCAHDSHTPGHFNPLQHYQHRPWHSDANNPSLCSSRS